MGERNKRTWFLTALAVPVTQAASECSWLTAAALGVLCLSLCWGLEKLGVPERKWLWGLKWAWMTVILGMVLARTQIFWETDSLVIPGTLVLLAAWAASAGEERGMRVGNLLRFFLIGLLGAVLLSGIPDIQWVNLRPAWRMNTENLITLLLLPAAGMRMGAKGIKPKGLLLGLILVVSVIVSGVLSEPYAAAQESPLFELSKGVRLFGAADRLESLASVGITLGNYVFLCWGLTLCGNWAKGVIPGSDTASVWLTAGVAVAASCFIRFEGGVILSLGTVLSFILLPILASIAEKWKTRKIFKKPLDK